MPPQSHQQHQAWRGLVKDFPERRLEAAEAIYAIPPTLLEAIEEHAPGFLSDADLRFEKRLAKTTRGGFFQRRAFIYPDFLLGDDFGDDPGDNPLEDARAVLKQLK